MPFHRRPQSGGVSLPSVPAELADPVLSSDPNTGEPIWVEGSSSLSAVGAQPGDVIAYDGDTSTWKAASVAAAVEIRDTTPPTVPTGLNAAPGNAQVVLAWGAVAVADLNHYSLRRDGVEIQQVPAGTTEYTDSGLTNGAAYSYDIAAVDTVGNVSAYSIAVSATPSAPTSVTRIENTDVEISYAGSTWAFGAAAAASGGSRHYANSPGTGATASWTAPEACEVTAIMLRSAWSPRMEVRVGGLLVDTVDLYSATTQWQQPIGPYAVGAGQTVEFRHAGPGATGNANPAMEFDAIDVATW